MNYLKTFIILLISYSITTGQSIGINNDNSSPDPSAILDVKSTTKGMLIPRMNTVQRTSISSPAAGLLVFDTNTGSFWFHDGTSWTNLISSGGGGNSISDADGDTKVDTELNPDEDIIRFTTNGTEMARMDGTTFHIGTPDQSIFIGNNSGANDAGGSSNVAVGNKSLEENTTGENNIAIGEMALKNNTTKSGSIAIGDSSLFNNGIGEYKAEHSVNNIAIGSKSLQENTRGDNNISIGTNAMKNNLTGRYNIAIGAESLNASTTGNSNIAIGGKSQAISNGHHNTSIGLGTLEDNLTGIRNSALGNFALSTNTIGQSNIGLGFFSLYRNTEGNYNTGVGVNSLYDNTVGNSNSSLGYNSLRKNTEGGRNVAVGTHSLYHNTIKSNLVAVGDSALYNNGSLSNASGLAEKNTAIGSKSLFSNDEGSNNTAVGYESLKDNTSARYNTAMGTQSLLHNTVGEFNTAVGYESLRDNISAQYNTALGAESLLHNTVGSGNTALGHQTLLNNIDGDRNVAVGINALTNLGAGNDNISIGAASSLLTTSSFHNTIIGNWAGYYSTTGDNNTYLGYRSGYTTTSGGNNTLLGYQAGRGASSHSKSGSVMIGHEAGYFETSSNKLYIDNSNTSDPLIYGDFSTNTLRVNGSLEIGNEYALPSSDGLNGEVLITDGSGNLSWAGSTPGLWTDGPSSTISYDAGNVGIGVTNPTSKLQIENNAQSIGIEIKHTYSGTGPSEGVSVYNNGNSGTGPKTGIKASIIPGSATTANGISAIIWPQTGNPGDVDDYTAITAFANGEATALRAYTNNVNGKAASFEGDVEFKQSIGTKNQINVYPANSGGAIGNSTIYLASDAQGAIGHKIEHDSISFRILNYKTLIGDTERMEINNDGVVRFAEDAFILDPDVSGNSRLTTDEIEIRGGSDLAEYFDIKPSEGKISPGTLVSIDPENPGKLKITKDPNCPLIAGVISGAEGIKPGMMMGQEGTLAFGEYPITLTGRVYVKANNQGGEIKPGDILTSSYIAGEAMKVDLDNIIIGTTIGKALSGINGNGYVLTLVSLN